MDNTIRELRMPPTISPSFQGTVKEFQSSFRNLSILLIVAILVIYIVLGMLYESFIHPITILSGLPSAVFGALLTLVMFHKQLDLFRVRRHHYAVRRGEEERDHDDRFRHRRAQPGRSAYDAIWQGCLLRFRPIMMTTVAALFGTLPIALGLRRRRGRAPAAGPGGGGRLGGEPVPDALYHAGDLSVSGEGAAEGGGVGGRAPPCRPLKKRMRYAFPCRDQRKRSAGGRSDWGSPPPRHGSW